MDRSWSGSLRASVTPISFEALDACVPRGELAIEALQAGGVDLLGSHWDHYNGAAVGRRTALSSIAALIVLWPKSPSKGTERRMQIWPPCYRPNRSI
jgi:hypothetical protein